MERNRIMDRGLDSLFREVVLQGIAVFDHCHKFVEIMDISWERLQQPNPRKSRKTSAKPFRNLCSPILPGFQMIEFAAKNHRLNGVQLTIEPHLLINAVSDMPMVAQASSRRRKHRIIGQQSAARTVSANHFGWV